MQGDFDDIRFTRADGTTLVDAWAEVIITDTSATVWVEFPSTPANTVEQDYYMYYGNGSAVSDWDDDATFEVADDFEDGTTNKWTDETNSNFVAVGAPVKYGSYAAHHYATTAWSESYYSFTEITGDRVVDVWLRKGETNQRSDFLIELVGGDYNNSIEIYFDTAGNIYLVRDGGNDLLQSYSANTWYHFVITLHSAADYTCDVDIDDVNRITGGTTRGTVDGIAGIGVMSAGVEASDLYVDNLFIRKHVSGPPTYAFGSEESATNMPAIIHHLRQQGIL
jgi:hypothetical protein